MSIAVLHTIIVIVNFTVCVGVNSSSKVTGCFIVEKRTLPLSVYTCGHGALNKEINTANMVGG